jgi:hypothetical protein
MGALGLPWSSRGTERPEALAELRRIVAEHPKTEYAAAAALGLVIESECDVARGDLAATDFVREWTTIGSALAEDHIAPWLGHHAMRVLGGRPMDQAALLRGWMKSSPGTYLASAARQLAKQCGVTLMGER